MAEFAVDLELLDEFVTRMSRFEQELETVHHSVLDRVRRVEAVWTGVAAEQAGAAHQRWSAGTGEMHEALATLRAIARTAHDNYAAALRASARMWAL